IAAEQNVVDGSTRDVRDVLGAGLLAYWEGIHETNVCVYLIGLGRAKSVEITENDRAFDRRVALSRLGLGRLGCKRCHFRALSLPQIAVIRPALVMHNKERDRLGGCARSMPERFWRERHRHAQRRSLQHQRLTRFWVLLFTKLLRMYTLK